LLAFRNLAEEGGPGYSEEQVKALAATFTISDPEAVDGERPGIPADHWPSLMSPADGAAAFGVAPPDFSVLAKARGVQKPGIAWVLDYFTAYQEGGPDYIYNLLIHYAEPPEGVEVADGQYYNAFTGSVLAMPPPLSDGLVTYEDDTIPMTVEQYSKDVSAFMMWVAEPHLVARKELGFKVLIVLVLFAALMYLAKRKLWSNVPH
jgi:ubiquinol-cytochrome c reductase cytochrome c1 subunit